MHCRHSTHQHRHRRISQLLHSWSMTTHILKRIVVCKPKGSTPCSAGRCSHRRSCRRRNCCIAAAGSLRIGQRQAHLRRLLCGHDSRGRACKPCPRISVALQCSNLLQRAFLQLLYICGGIQKCQASENSLISQSKRCRLMPLHVPAAVRQTIPDRLARQTRH